MLQVHFEAENPLESLEDLHSYVALVYFLSQHMFGMRLQEWFAQAAENTTNITHFQAIEKVYYVTICTSNLAARELVSKGGAWEALSFCLLYAVLINSLIS